MKSNIRFIVAFAAFLWSSVCTSQTSRPSDYSQEDIDQAMEKLHKRSLQRAQEQRNAPPRVQRDTVQAQPRETVILRVPTVASSIPATDYELLRKYFHETVPFETDQMVKFYLAEAGKPFDPGLLPFEMRGEAAAVHQRMQKEYREKAEIHLKGEPYYPSMRFEVGSVGVFARLRVVQIVSDSDLLVEEAGEDARSGVRWLSGLPTGSIVDGAFLKGVVGVYDGTKSYESLSGKVTVHSIRTLMLLNDIPVRDDRSEAELLAEFRTIAQQLGNNPRLQNRLNSVGCANGLYIEQVINETAAIVSVGGRGRGPILIEGLSTAGWADGDMIRNTTAILHVDGNTTYMTAAGTNRTILHARVIAPE